MTISAISLTRAGNGVATGRSVRAAVGRRAANRRTVDGPAPALPSAEFPR